MDTLLTGVGLPVKPRSMVKCEGHIYLRSEHDVTKWTENGANFIAGLEIVNRGFEIIYEGVDV